MSLGKPLSVRNLVCEFPGVRALDNISLDFEPGVVHAITGENGAGKSTLLNALSGKIAPKTGYIELGGRTFTEIQNAWRLGIRAVPQEPLLAEDLSVAENIWLGAMAEGGSSLVDWPSLLQKTRLLLERIGLGALPPTQLVRRLSLGQKQLIQVARALTPGGSVYLFDEPTSSLTSAETKYLADIIQHLASLGAVVLLVSHRIADIFGMCQSVSVLRDGRLVGTRCLANIKPPDLIRMMIGRDIPQRAEAPRHIQSAECLRVDQISWKQSQQPISLRLEQGEILGLAGLEGAGRPELMETIFGARTAVSGNIAVDGQIRKVGSPQDAKSSGIALVPADRKRDGLVLQMDVASNALLPNLTLASRFGFLLPGRIRKLYNFVVEKMRVNYRNPKQRVETLSGGNQQKVAIGKHLAWRPRILLADEPTRGVDLLAKAEIHQSIRQLAAEGTSVLLSSSDMPELLQLCDRVMVLKEGEISGELRGEGVTEEAILKLAAPGLQTNPRPDAA